MTVALLVGLYIFTNIFRNSFVFSISVLTVGLIVSLFFKRVAHPSPPPAPVLIQVTATTMTIQWTAGTEDPIKSYFLMYKQSSHTGDFMEIPHISDTTYTIQGLLPFTRYDVKVSAVNTIGRGDPSSALIVTTAELGK